VTRGRRIGAAAAVLAFGLAFPARAATPDAAETLAGTVRREVGESADRVRSAEDALRAVDARQQALEREILELKREGENRGRLTELLRASVQAEAALEARLAKLDDARDRLRRRVRAAVRRIDTALRERARGLRTGARADRRAAAEAIRALLAVRTWALEVEQRLDPPVSVGSGAHRLAVPTIEPLDGPDELREKADFAEDARDKLQKKGERLRKLVARRRQTRDIARAARDFAVDVSLFDEEVRSAVVARGGASVADEGSAGRGGGSGPGVGGEPIELGDQPGTGDAADSPGRMPNVDGGAADPTFGGGGGGRSDGPPAAGGGGPSPGGGASSGPSLSAGNMPPVVLLSLEVDQLAAEDVDVESLEALVQAYQRLETLFSARARAMRARARRLDEAPPDE